MPARVKKIKKYESYVCGGNCCKKLFRLDDRIALAQKSEVDIDLTKALNILDKDHYGLEKVKERIIEFLAVQKRMEKIKGPILA